MEVWKGVLLIHSTDIHWQRPPPRGDREATCGGSVSHLFKPQCAPQGPLLKATWPVPLWTPLRLAWCGPEVFPLLPAPSLPAAAPAKAIRALPSLRTPWELGRLLAAGSWHNLGMDLLTRAPSGLTVFTHLGPQSPLEVPWSLSPGPARLRLPGLLSWPLQVTLPPRASVSSLQEGQRTLTCPWLRWGFRQQPGS